MKRHRMEHRVVFLDLIMNALLCFTALFIVAYVQIRPESEDEPVIKTEGQFAVILEWPDDSEDDVDLYVRNPRGTVSYFQSRDVGLMHLEHDDLGSRNDVVSEGGVDIRVATNQERVIIRGIIPGEYTVNVHMYSKRDPRPTRAIVALFRIRGRDHEIVKKERVLDHDGHEHTAFRFTLDRSGLISKINEMPRTIAGDLMKRELGGGP